MNLIVFHCAVSFYAAAIALGRNTGFNSAFTFVANKGPGSARNLVDTGRYTHSGSTTAAKRSRIVGDLFIALRNYPYTAVSCYYSTRTDMGRNIVCYHIDSDRTADAYITANCPAYAYRFDLRSSYSAYIQFLQIHCAALHLCAGLLHDPVYGNACAYCCCTCTGSHNSSIEYLAVRLSFYSNISPGCIVIVFIDVRRFKYGLRLLVDECRRSSALYGDLTCAAYAHSHVQNFRRINCADTNCRTGSRRLDLRSLDTCIGHLTSLSCIAAGTANISISNTCTNACFRSGCYIAHYRISISSIGSSCAHCLSIGYFRITDQGICLAISTC